MPNTYGEQLTAVQLEMVLDYLLAGAAEESDEIGAEPTETTTPQPSQTAVAEATPETDGNSSNNLPGFLVGLGAGGLGAAAYVFRQRRKSSA